MHGRFSLRTYVRECFINKKSIGRASVGGNEVETPIPPLLLFFLLFSFPPPFFGPPCTTFWCVMLKKCSSGPVRAQIDLISTLMTHSNPNITEEGAFGSNKNVFRQRGGFVVLLWRWVCPVGSSFAYNMSNEPLTLIKG